MASTAVEVKFSMPPEKREHIFDTAKALLADDVPRGDVLAYVRDELAKCITFTPPLRKDGR